MLHTLRLFGVWFPRFLLTGSILFLELGVLIQNGSFFFLYSNLLVVNMGGLASFFFLRRLIWMMLFVLSSFWTPFFVDFGDAKSDFLFFMRCYYVSCVISIILYLSSLFLKYFLIELVRKDNITSGIWLVTQVEL